MKTTTDRTGTMVMASSESGTKMAIYRDNGHYDGKSTEYDVRALTMVRDLPGMTIMSDAVKTIVARGDAYGCGWGDIGRLSPITDADLAMLIAASNKADAAHKATKNARDAAKDAEIARVASDPDLCPRCGTYCYGDCTASA